MNVEIYLALSHLMSRRKGAWAWIISLMTTASVTLGVTSLVVTLAVMTGFREDIESKILGVQPHLTLLPWGPALDAAHPGIEKTLRNDPEVAAWSPFVGGQLLVGSRGRSAGAVVKGIVPEREKKVVGVQARLVQGRWESLEGARGSKPAVIIGRELARMLAVGEGDEVWAISPGDAAESLGGVPRMRRLAVGGVIETGYYEWDTGLVLMNIGEAQSLFDMGRGVSGIGVRLHRADRAEAAAERLRTTLQGTALVTTWSAMNRNLFAALQLEKRVMFLILILVTLVASFMIVSNLLLTVTQRVKEIGILRAMGATPGRIRRIFMVEGILMGGTGTALGLALGIAVSKVVAATRLVTLPSDVYYIDRLPAKIVWPDLFAVAFAAGLITFLAAVYPAHRASRLDPLEAIRYG